MSLLSVVGLGVNFIQYGEGLKQRMTSPVTDISVWVEPGEIVGVIGTSGGGKSLLAHAILGVLPANAVVSGSIQYKGREVNSNILRSLRGREIVLLPQSVGFLNPRLKVGTQLHRRAVVAGRENPAAAVKEALARFNLEKSTEGLYPHQLSGGMARRVLMASATMSDMDLLIADEPTPGLDMENVINTFCDLRRIADAGAGVLVVSHDVEQLCAVADRLCVVDAGRTVDTVRPDELRLERGAHPFTRALWRSLPENWDERRMRVAYAGS